MEQGATISPDGRAVAYLSNESGKTEVYAQTYPGPGVKRRVSVDGGSGPAWSHTGHELFYQTATGMFSVPILDTRDLRIGAPVRLFPLGQTSSWRTQVSGDDQRFLMLERAEASPAMSRINIVQNWVEELKHLVPTK